MKLTHKIIATILLSLSCGSVATAQSVTLSVERCREMAIENNFNLKSSNLAILQSEDIYSQYRSNFFPKISLSASYLYSTASLDYTIEGGYLPTYVVDGTTGELVANVAGVAADGSYIFNQYAYMPDQLFEFSIGSVFNTGVSLTQPIYLGGKVTNAVKLARLGKDVAQLNLQRGEAEVIAASDEAFYTYVKVEEMLASAEKYHQTLQEFYRQMESVVEKGMSTRNNLLKVQVRLDEAELMLLKAQNGLRIARMNLCYQIGLPLTTDTIEIQDFQEHTPLNTTTTLDVTARPEYALLQKQVEAKKLETELTKSDFRPSVVVLGSYGYTNGLSFNGATAINGCSFVGGVTVSVPIFSFGEGRSKISASNREVDIAQNTFDDMSQKMELELMHALNSYEESKLQVALMERALLSAQENMRVGHSHYFAGMETLTDYLESQTLWQQAMSNLIDAKCQMRLAYTYYLKAAGELE